MLEQPRPVRITLASGQINGRATGYESVNEFADGFVGTVAVQVTCNSELEIADCWRTSKDGEVTVSRVAVVHGNDRDGFMTSIGIARNVATRFADVTLFAPGAVYGDCEPILTYAIAGAPLCRRGLRYALCREDRLAAPLFVVRFADGEWLAVLHEHAEAANTVSDCGHEAGGESLIDPRFSFASMGSVVRGERLELGAWFPGTEGEATYSSGGLPLRQYRRWRRRFHPLREDVIHRYELVYRVGTSSNPQVCWSAAWRWAWETLAPRVELVDTGTVVKVSTAVLASQAEISTPLAGIPLEVDAVTGQKVPNSPAIMGFVGANTDAAYLLLRVGTRIGGEIGDRYRLIGTRIMDSFVTVGLSPPQGEGFDLSTGHIATYRKVRGRPTVFLRSVSDGCAAALRAWQLESRTGQVHNNWLEWAVQGADWLVSVQRRDGSFARSFEAGTGAVMDNSTTATQVPVAFLASLERATGRAIYLEAAIRAGEFCWRTRGETACFAGATLDNPNVVDKEAAIMALEGFLELYESTGNALWVEQARIAAEIAETWIYIWNIPMPVDADDRSLHWKKSVPTIGQQLIATGVSMCDGFLARNAAAFVILSRLSGDEHFLDVARVVTHGTKAMLALPGRTYDLCGEGWQQEHWCFAVRRGYGLNRNWLPWVSVAHIEGILRLEDIGALGFDADLHAEVQEDQL